jgi:hypothetical protein
VAVAQWQWGNGLENDPKMSRIGALLAELWMFCFKVAVAVAGGQWMGGSGWVAVGNGLQNDPKMSRIGALLAEFWTSLL